MVGAIIITHGRLASALLEAAENIAGRAEGVRPLSVKDGGTAEEIMGMVRAALKEVDSGGGVIIFTDMFGGTPTNIALSLLKEGRTEIITGVNLPLVIKFLNWRDGVDISTLASRLLEHGRKSIVLASEMLKGER
ncbi:MAG: PTS sugar transporter subunit IIA [Deltaproteobacteria bacterium]|nr:PTS sugar transporter subunit IIA [Deltaproteobacteria bacterium]